MVLRRGNGTCSVRCPVWLFNAQYGKSISVFLKSPRQSRRYNMSFFFRDDVPPIIASWKWKINLQIRKLSQFFLTSYVSTQQASDRWDSGRLVTFDGASKASASVSVCVSETDTMIQGKSKISCDALKETIIFYISMYQEAYKSRNS